MIEKNIVLCVSKVYILKINTTKKIRQLIQIFRSINTHHVHLSGIENYFIVLIDFFVSSLTFPILKVNFVYAFESKNKYFEKNKECRPNVNQMGLLRRR